MNDVAILGIMLPIVSVVSIVIMVVYLRRYENKERMAMIEKGVNPEIFRRQGGGTSGTLRFSLLLMGVGLGFLVGYFLDRTFDMREVGYFSMLFIFGGIGLGLAYFIEESKLKSGR